MCSICAESGAESYASSPPSAGSSNFLHPLWLVDGPHPSGSAAAAGLGKFPPSSHSDCHFPVTAIRGAHKAFILKVANWLENAREDFQQYTAFCPSVYCSQKRQISLAKLQKEAIYINSEQSRLSWEGWSTVFCLPCDNTFHWNGLFPYVQICKLTTFFKKIKQRKRTISILKLPSGFIC